MMDCYDILYIHGRQGMYPTGFSDLDFSSTTIIKSTFQLAQYFGSAVL